MYFKLDLCILKIGLWKQGALNSEIKTLTCIVKIYAWKFLSMLNNFSDNMHFSGEECIETITTFLCLTTKNILFAIRINFMTIESSVPKPNMQKTFL